MITKCVPSTIYPAAHAKFFSIFNWTTVRWFEIQELFTKNKYVDGKKKTGKEPICRHCTILRCGDRKTNPLVFVTNTYVYHFASQFRLLKRMRCSINLPSPFWHWWPWNPGVHKQRYPLSVKPVWQVALLMQGLLAQPLYIVNRKRKRCKKRKKVGRPL